MAKDILTILGIDAVAAAMIWTTDPSFLKWILGLGIASLIGFMVLSKGQGRVSIYGSNLVMAFLVATHYIP